MFERCVARFANIYIYCIQATVPFEKQGVEVGDGFGVVVVITVGASSKR